MRQQRARALRHALVALVVTSVILIASLGMWQASPIGKYQELQRQVHGTAEIASGLIENSVRPGAPLLVQDDPLSGPLLVPQLRRQLDALPQITVVLDADGRAVYRSVAARLLESESFQSLLADAQRLEGDIAGVRGIKRDTTGDAGAYLRFQRIPREERVLFVHRTLRPPLRPLSAVITAAPTTVADTTRAEIVWGGLVVSFLTVLGLLAAYVIAAGRGRDPLDRMIDSVEAITDGRSLHRRVSLHEEDEEELQRLAFTLNAMIERLETSFGALRQFTADASHELKTPLTVMRANIERAMGAAPESAEQMIALEEALHESRRMGDLVNSLLTLARFDEGRFDLHLLPVQVAPLIRDVFETAELLGEPGKIRVSLASLDEAMVYGDETWLRQLFLNLVTNAIKYTPPNGSVELALRVNDDLVTFTVRDTGIGISAADLPHVFDRFWRADRVRSRVPTEVGKPDRGGFGLGLAISQWIAHAHGGSITVTSRLTRGTTFTVQLPLALPDDQNGVAASR